MSDYLHGQVGGPLQRGERQEPEPPEHHLDACPRCGGLDGTHTLRECGVEPPAPAEAPPWGDFTTELDFSTGNVVVRAQKSCDLRRFHEWVTQALNEAHWGAAPPSAGPSPLRETSAEELLTRLLSTWDKWLSKEHTKLAWAIETDAANPFLRTTDAAQAWLSVQRRGQVVLGAGGGAPAGPSPTAALPEGPWYIWGDEATAGPWVTVAHAHGRSLVLHGLAEARAVRDALNQVAGARAALAGGADA